MKYPKTMRAAKGISTNEKALAEAIFIEIPPRGKGRTPAGTTTIEDALTEMAAELSAEGYAYSTAVLAEYREVAAWANGNTRAGTGISWQPVAWSVHVEAYKGGMRWRDFVKHVGSGTIKIRDDLRRIFGNRPGRPNTTEKVKDLVGDVKAGKVTKDDLEELADALDEGTVSKTVNRRRQRRINEDIAANEEGMTDEEVEDTDKAIDSLQQGVRDLRSIGKQMEDVIVGSPLLQSIKEAEHAILFALVMTKRHQLANDEEQTIATASLDNTTHIADMVRMAIGGFSFSRDDEKFLQQAAQELGEAADEDR